MKAISLKMKNSSTKKSLNKSNNVLEQKCKNGWAKLCIKKIHRFPRIPANFTLSTMSCRPKTQNRYELVKKT